MAHGLTPLQSALAEIDWQRPWLTPWRDAGTAVWVQLQSGLSLHASLNAVADGMAHQSPVRFVEQSALDDATPYEQFIFVHRQCPTRENLHDFFNGLAWLLFPRTKAMLNAAQARQITLQGTLQGSPSSRGRVRDAITVFDENGGVFLGSTRNAALWSSLQSHDWQGALVSQRSQWLAEPPVLLFGHALLEKLLQPRKPMVAHLFCIHPTTPEPDLVQIDAALAAQLSEKLSEPATQTSGARLFQPLPVLGIPGWSADNTDPHFYADSHVFRAARSPKHNS